MMSEFPLLCIDHGTKYLGFAVCDRIGLLAKPLQVWERKSKKEDFAFIQRLIAKEQVLGILVGLPPRPPDFVGHAQADTVMIWVRRLQEIIELPIYLWDEGLSSYDAEEQLRSVGRSGLERVDAHAAAVILQTFLDTLREGEAWPEPLDTPSS